MNSKEALEFLDEVRKVAKEEAQKALMSYVKVIPVVVVSVSDLSAVVRPTTATDASQNFTVPIVTAQTVSAGVAASVAYWANLSTGILIAV